MPSFDATKPASSTFLVSSEIRQNFDALTYALAPNQVADPTFLIWAAGDSAAPSHWTLTGAGATITRTGTGLGDTTRKAGKFAAKVVAGGGAAAKLTQDLLTTTTYDDIFDAETFSFGCWAKTSSSNAGRMYIDDGFSTTATSYHTGDGTFQWLTATRTIDVSATKIQVVLEAAAGTTVYWSGPTVIFGPIKPSAFRPAPSVYGVLYFPTVGNAATGTKKSVWVPSRPGIVKDVQLRCETAPTTQAIIVDVNTWDGSAFTSMFSTRPQIAASGNQGGAQPDTTYARRCLSGLWGSSLSAGGALSWDVDQVGSGTVGADLAVHVRVLQFARPLESFLGYNEVA